MLRSELEVQRIHLNELVDCVEEEEKDWQSALFRCCIVSRHVVAEKVIREGGHAQTAGRLGLHRRGLPGDRILRLTERLVLVKEVVLVVEPFFVDENLETFYCAVVRVEEDLSEGAEECTSGAAVWTVDQDIFLSVYDAMVDPSGRI